MIIKENNLIDVGVWNNKEEHPIIGDDQGLDFLGSEFTGP